MRFAVRVALWLARSIAIVLLVIVCSTVLVRLAPGYLSDAREMDGRYGNAVRAELSAESRLSTSFAGLLASELRGWMRGDAGISREYGVPVSELISPRLAVSFQLMIRALSLAWAISLCSSLLSSAARKSRLLWQVPAAVLLAVPTAAMATLCLAVGCGGPVLVMALLLVARDFKFLHHALRRCWLDPHVLQARAQGIRPHRLILGYLLPSIGPHLMALGSLSIITALSALVPVEVIFNTPGIGQLAWSAALNRDLPVLLSITALMAVGVMLAGLASERPSQWRSA